MLVTGITTVRDKSHGTLSPTSTTGRALDVRSHQERIIVSTILKGVIAFTA
jgi:hypothetical protein